MAINFFFFFWKVQKMSFLLIYKKSLFESLQLVQILTEKKYRMEALAMLSAQDFQKKKVNVFLWLSFLNQKLGVGLKI